MRRKGQPQPVDGAAHHRLAELAARQHGVVSVRQLLGSLGYSRGAVARAAGSGRLHRLHRGIYAVGHTRLSRHGHHLAAVLACGRGALLSHSSAAWLWGISAPPAAIEVTTPGPRRARASIRTHRARSLRPEDRATVEGIPVTALPRTLLDLAAALSPRRLDRAIEQAERVELFDLGPVESLLARSTGHPGAGRLHRALTLYRTEPAFVRSRLEERFLDIVRRAGLPRPATNLFVEGYELDAYWPDERFAVELDSYEFHRTRAAFERDRRRQEELKLAGIEMLRVTDRRMSAEPGQLAERIAALLQRRRRE